MRNFFFTIASLCSIALGIVTIPIPIIISGVIEGFFHLFMPFHTTWIIAMTIEIILTVLLVTWFDKRYWNHKNDDKLYMSYAALFNIALFYLLNCIFLYMIVQGSAWEGQGDGILGLIFTVPSAALGCFINGAILDIIRKFKQKRG